MLRRLCGIACAGQQELGNTHIDLAEMRPKPIGKACAGQQEPGNTHIGPAEVRPKPIGKASAD